MSQKKGTQEKIPELLAPAGSLETAIAAYGSGADAVYLGLDRYNARIPAENFSIDQVSKLAAYAKKHGRKYYLAINTLLKENELEDVVGLLEEVTALEPDGVIVQDLGMVRLLREVFPSLPIHASTQMGIHNSAGVAAAERLGIERVILERQVTMEELEGIVNRAKTEIEVFIHGALCCSLSGRCLFSSWIGGWSGNRGRCKQPCRRRYYSNEKGSKKAGFYFSTRDLYTLDLLPELKRIGVASLKIEGRLKKPDYVQNVVRAYRMMIDTPKQESEKTLKQAKLVLSGSYGRHWSHGFATPEDMKEVVQPGSIGVSGLLIGELIDVRNGKLHLRLDRRLHVGDRIRVQAKDGQESPSLTVKTMFHRGQSVKSCAKGEVELPDAREAQPGSLVYKVGASVKRAGPRSDGLPLFIPRPRVDLKIGISRTSFNVVVDNLAGDRGIEWHRVIELPDAKKHGINPAEVRRVFQATGIDSFQTGYIELETEEGLFLPPSLLKTLRREFWEYAKTSGFSAEELTTKPDGARDRFRKVFEALPRTTKERRKEVSCAGRSGRGVKCTFQVDSLYSFNKKTDEVELPHFCSESALEIVSKKIKEAVESGVRRFRLTDLYQFELLRAYKGLQLNVGFPMPVTNSLTAGELLELGAGKVQAWVELDRRGIEQLASRAPLPVEIYRYGRPFILVSRAEVGAVGPINDHRGKNFKVVYSPIDRLYYLYPYEVLKINDLTEYPEYRDFRQTGESEKVFSTFNFETEFV